MVVRFSLGLLLIAALSAQTGGGEIRERLRPVLHQALANAEVPGLAVAVLRDGQPVYLETLGLSDLASREPVTPDTLFELASVTKTFVATAILQLAEQGKVDLDAHPAKYLPYFHSTDPRAQRLTIRQLLSHTSGLADDRDPAFDKPEFDESALERFVRSFAPRPLEFAPQEKFGYSNLGYCVLGDVVAKVSGKSFEEYVKRHILEPLGMTGSELLLSDVKRRSYARPYIVDGAYSVSPGAVYPYNRRRAPASAMHSSLNDLVRWALVHLNRGELDGKRILKASTYDQMWKPAGPEYGHIGLGWFLWKRDGETLVGHNGSDTGFVADFELVPARNIAVIVLCNLDHGPYRAIVSAALDAAMGKTSTVSIKPSLAKVIYQALMVGGPDAAVRRYHQIRSEEDGRYDFTEWVLNDLGYKLARQGKHREAIRILRLNVEAYPASANVYDSLGGVCYQAGDNACALENYQKAFERNPKNRKASEIIKKIEAGLQ